MTADSMVAQAEKSLGLGEPNYIQSWYCQKKGICGNFAWCDAAITYWAWQSGNQPAVTFNGYYAYTVGHADRFKNAGQWHVDIAGIRRGDIVFFDWGFSNRISAIDHVGIVTGRNGGDIFTIEGNTSNRCMRRVRHSDSIAGYGRPHYTGSGTPPPTPAPPGHVVYEPFPGKSFFSDGRVSGIITRMGKRLVANGCGQYEQGPGPTWTANDKKSYATWQRKCHFTGDDADGTPGKESWDRLKVPRQ